MKQQKALTLKTLTKSNVWEVEENDIFRMWETAEKESDFKDNRNHYMDVIRSAFEIEEIKIDKPEVIKKYEARDFKVGNIHFDDNDNKNGALRSVQSTASQILHTRIYIIFLLQNLLKFLIVTSAVVGIHCRRAYRI